MMPASLETYFSKLSAHRYGTTFAAYVISAFITGVACVAFMKAFAFADEHRLSYAHIGVWSFLAIPLLFSLAVLLVKNFAPYAAGSGIPQAIYIVRNGSDARTAPLVSAMASPLTLGIKTVSILLAVLGGASVGREGPTVQIAFCMMFMCLTLISRFLPIHMEPRSTALAGGAAGLAAASNTPLAGVTFAIEELSGGYFENIKDYVLTAIIIAALAAKALTGEYVYFGRLPVPPDISISTLILISIPAGLAGFAFAKSILLGAKVQACLNRKWLKLLFPAACALAVAGLAFMAGPYIQGPGNGEAQQYLNFASSAEPDTFFLAKFAATVITYWSGVAGGLFAPALSIGSAIGAEMAKLLNAPIGTCALIGMSAFLSGAILAPMTSFVIIFELTGHHSMLLPIMLASLIAYLVVRSMGGRSLYAELSLRYNAPAAVVPSENSKPPNENTTS